MMYNKFVINLFDASPLKKIKEGALNKLIKNLLYNMENKSKYNIEL